MWPIGLPADPLLVTPHRVPARSQSHAVWDDWCFRTVSHAELVRLQDFLSIEALVLPGIWLYLPRALSNRRTEDVTLLCLMLNIICQEDLMSWQSLQTTQVTTKSAVEILLIPAMNLWAVQTFENTIVTDSQVHVDRMFTLVNTVGYRGAVLVACCSAWLLALIVSWRYMGSKLPWLNLQLSLVLALLKLKDFLWQPLLRIHSISLALAHIAYLVFRDVLNRI